MATRRTKKTSSSDPVENAIRALIEALGRKASGGMEATPARAAEAWRVFTRGYASSAREVFLEGTFEAGHDGIVLVRGIDFFSICEHHLVPFFGKCHIAYLPSGKIAGLSKFARLVDVHARRLQVQERMTSEIAAFLNETLHPRGVAVIVEGQHMCAMMRGVKKLQTRMVTRAMLGAYKDDTALCSELLAQISFARSAE